MTATSSVSSNALNFMSAIKNGVDERTGLYKVSISLPEIKTNDLRGPGFALALAYSPLNTRDSGYGYGWNMQLTEYSLGSRILSVSTGETFKVTGSESEGDKTRLVMKEQKLDSFHFYEVKRDELYRVVHKSGLVEILEVHGSLQNRVALPVEIYSPAGHRIKLQYKTFNGVHQILEWIKDDSDVTLLTLERASTFIKMMLRPFDGPEDGPLATFEMTLESSTNYVTRITLPTEERASWRFAYEIINNQVCMQSVETPSGGREEIYYDLDGHRFPGGSTRRLPRVSQHLTLTGYKDQPVLDVRYTYKSHPNDTETNFLGYGLNIDWLDDGLDNLYRWPDDYEYVCIETLFVSDRAVRTIDRKYNKFHLLTQETTTQNTHVRTVKTTYNLTPGYSFDRQPKNCQLPQKVETIWSIAGNSNSRRTETESKTYDSYGNQLVYTQATGVVETQTWYPAKGEEGQCPPDPEGFVRYLKDVTVTPAASTDSAAPTLRTRSRYKEMKALEGTTLPNWITLDRQVLIQVEDGIETALEHTDYKYADDPSDPFLHGRLSSQEKTLNGNTTVISYSYEKLISEKLKIPVQKTTEILTTSFDTVKRTVIREHSLFTSQEVLNRIDGVEIHYFYDALNRLVREFVNSESFPAERTYEYTLSTAYGQQAEQTAINAKGVKTRSVMDGLGRLVFQERDHVYSDNAEQVEQTYAAVYDEWANLVEETDFDWLDGKGLKLKSSFFYDDWAHRYRVVGSDGVETYDTIDPIGTADWRAPIHKSWTQSDDTPPVKSGISKAWINLFGKPAKVSNLDAAEAEYATQDYEYDGLGQTTKHTDASRFVTRFAYDAWSRLITTTLPDGSIVTQSYAAHSSSELVVALSVKSGGKDITAGEQVFDGLGRLTQSTTGNRIERYTYQDDQLQVKTRTTPANQCIVYDYNLDLTAKPISCHAPDEAVDFTFDPVSARLTQARSGQGRREYTYDAANQLRSEHWVDQQEVTWETLYASSMQGRQLKRTDVKQADGTGLDTVYVYDDYGRVKNISQGQLYVEYAYNRLGQVASTTTKDLATNSSLVTTLAYDHQGREILRTLELDEQPVRTLEQIWKVDGLLATRDLKQNGVTLLKETFSYDSRGRLTLHECEGSTLPRDAEGRQIKDQSWYFDALDNILMSTTTFPDDTNELAFYSYSEDDPCQLKSIEYASARSTANPTFSYNLNGCLLNDERGNNLTYDSQNRLLRVENAGQVLNRYWYDGHDHLVNSQQGNQSETLHFYQDEQLTNTVQNGRKIQFLSYADQPLGQQQAGDNSQTLLLLTDPNHSVIGESQRRELRTAVYNAYGDRHGEKPLLSLKAFNGEVREDRGWYLLGRGYRAYNPNLMRFHSPDSLSPFGSGGINPYSYCLGNPIALRDPTGHSSIGWSGRLKRPDENEVRKRPMGSSNAWLSWVFVVIGAVATVVSAVLTVLTAGAAAPLLGAAFAFTAAKASVLAVGTVLAVGSTVTSAISAATGDKSAGEWGMYLGLASFAAGAAASVLGGLAKVVGEGFDDLLKQLKPLSTGKMRGMGPDRARNLAASAAAGMDDAPGQGGWGLSRVLRRYLPRAWTGRQSNPVSPQASPTVTTAPASRPGPSGSAVQYGSRDVNWRNKIEPVKVTDESTSGAQAGNTNIRSDDPMSY